MNFFRNVSHNCKEQVFIELHEGGIQVMHFSSKFYVQLPIMNFF